MAQSQIHRDCHELNQAGQNHSTSRRDRRPVRGRPVRGITVGCHRPPPSVARLLGPGSLGSGVCWGPGRQPRARAFWARQAIPRTTLPSPVVRTRFLRFPPSMPRDSRAPHWPGSGAQLRLQRPGWLRPHCASLPPVGNATGGRGETGVLVCEGVSDGLVGQSSFQFVSAAPVIGHSAAYRCR